MKLLVASTVVSNAIAFRDTSLRRTLEPGAGDAEDPAVEKQEPEVNGKDGPPPPPMDGEDYDMDDAGAPPVGPPLDDAGEPPLDDTGAPPVGPPPMDDAGAPPVGPPMDDAGAPPVGPPMDEYAPIEPALIQDGPETGAPPVGPPPMDDTGAPPVGPPMDDAGAPPVGPPMDDTGAPPVGPPMDDAGAPPVGPPMDDAGAPPVGPPMDDAGAPPVGPPMDEYEFHDAQEDEHEFHDLPEYGEIPAGGAFIQQEPTTGEASTEVDVSYDESNPHKIAPFGSQDTAQELTDQSEATQNTLVDAVENAEVAEMKRSVFRSLTRLRAATIKEFDTIARLETQAIDAYNDAHDYREQNPIKPLGDDVPVEHDAKFSFH